MRESHGEVSPAQAVPHHLSAGIESSASARAKRFASGFAIVTSTHGLRSTYPAGCGSPCAFSVCPKLSARPPPALSPIKTIR